MGLSCIYGSVEPTFDSLDPELLINCLIILGYYFDFAGFFYISVLVI